MESYIMESYNKTAFLFPGNDIDYRETLQKLSREVTFIQNLDKVNEYSRGLIENRDEPANNELYNQMVIYAICCSICDLYKQRNILPSVVSGYSLGIYSALYASEAYSFETGLAILTRAFTLVRQFYDKNEREFGMGVIIGLTEQEIVNFLFEKIGESLEIACINGHRSFVIVGESDAVRESLERAQTSGAFKTIRINTKFGYHTSFLKGQVERLYTFLNSCRIFEPRYKILSPINVNFVGKDAITNEIVKNLYSPVHWKALISAMVNEHNIRKGYEVGPGESLTKMARYIDNNLKVYAFG